MYKTMEYARIVCAKCGEEVTKLMPGQEFKAIPVCKCQEVKKPTPKKRAKKNEV